MPACLEMVFADETLTKVPKIKQEAINENSSFLVFKKIPRLDRKIIVILLRPNK